MKRIILVILTVMIAVPAFSQYTGDFAGKRIRKKGSALYIGGKRLTKDEAAFVLSPLEWKNGLGYDVMWKRSKSCRNAGIALTTIGSVAAVGGAVALACGMVTTVGGAMLVPIYIAFDGTEDMDSMMHAAQKMMIGGGLAIVGSVVILGTGIPLLCVGNSRMNRIVRDYNSYVSEKSGNAGLAVNFGPCRNGIGFSVNF